jgi:hypothetical protein
VSYCVHCGVQLAASEKDCPLCGTVVQDPFCAWQKPEQMPYSETVEVKNTHIDRRYARQLMAMAMLIPIVIVMLIDLVDGRGFGWSLLVSGTLVLIYCWIVVPILFKFSRPYAYILIDIISLSAYLLLIALITGGMGWYLGLVLPMLIWLSLVVMASVLAIRRLEMAPLYRAALVTLMTAAFLLGLELLINLHAEIGIRLNWSFFAAIPLGVIALMLALLENNTPLKEEIKKHLFI